MTPRQFRSARRALGLTQNALAGALGLKTSRIIRRWEAGTSPITGPSQVAMYFFLRESGIDPEGFGLSAPIQKTMKSQG